jgi:hypothetical protein
MSCYHGLLLPRFDEMSSSEYCTKEYTKTSYDTVRNSKERILATHDGSGGNQNRFGTAEFRHAES